MTLSITAAERILRQRLGEPAKPPTRYVIGFKTPTGRLLALHREASETRIWLQPPAPLNLEGVRLMVASARNSNLDGSLSPLNTANALRVEIDGEPALHRFIDWYDAAGLVASRTSVARPRLDPHTFLDAFARFQQLIAANDKGHAFTNFHEGVAGVWEGYKPRLRDRALSNLAAATWSESSIGSGAILQHTIDAIEIQDNHSNLINNLVLWQNRFGHANRDHHVLLDAVSDRKEARFMA